MFILLKNGLSSRDGILWRVISLDGICSEFGFGVEHTLYPVCVAPRARSPPRSRSAVFQSVFDGSRFFSSF